MAAGHFRRSSHPRGASWSHHDYNNSGVIRQYLGAESVLQRGNASRLGWTHLLSLHRTKTSKYSADSRARCWGSFVKGWEIRCFYGNHWDDWVQYRHHFSNWTLWQERRRPSHLAKSVYNNGSCVFRNIRSDFFDILRRLYSRCSLRCCEAKREGWSGEDVHSSSLFCMLWLLHLPNLLIKAFKHKKSLFRIRQNHERYVETPNL